MGSPDAAISDFILLLLINRVWSEAHSVRSSLGKCPGHLQVLRGTKGKITSPEYGTRYGYPNDAECVWKIVVPRRKVIKLDVVRLSVEPSPECTYDRVEVRDGYSSKSPLLATFCSPLLVGWKGFSSSNVILVTFKSDSSFRFPGFWIEYTAVLPEHPSEQTVADSEVRKCGKPNEKPWLNNLRIVGGREAKSNSWPWQVGIKLIPEQVFFSCGASIINPTWILTAAHCMFNKHGWIVPQWRMRLYVGTHKLFIRSMSETIHTVRRLIPHPKFRISSKGYDIGLIEIKPPIKFSTIAQPICLPDSEKGPPLGANCFATGWGLTKGTGSMTVLNQAQIPILKNQECSSPWIYGSFFKEDMLCGGHLRGGEDTCRGDSGGPLACLTGDAWFLEGITSWGLGCGKKSYPGVYTKIGHYLEWIRNYVKNV